MKLTRLVRANDRAVEKWLCDSLDLSPYQKEKLRNKEIVRFSGFEFYTRPEKQSTSLWWRLTLIVFPIYIILIFCFSFLKWVFTGKWGVGVKFYDGFHAKWCKKLDIHFE